MVDEQSSNSILREMTSEPQTGIEPINLLMTGESL